MKDSADQVHATVPLTNAESICIISVGPLPYVLYTAGKLVRMEHFHGRGYILIDCSLSFIPRLRSTSFHLLPSLSLCSDLEQGFQSFQNILLENVTSNHGRVAKRLSTIFLGAPATCECAPGGEELQLPHSCPKVAPLSLLEPDQIPFLKS